MKYAKSERVWLGPNSEADERWVQDRIAEDPSLLGLGELILKDKERMQPRAGRLDLLLQDPETNHRYEVEVQLGKTDEAHIIRTIEYWDIERRRYPQYDHTAVLVAEDVTSRFLNVIGLLNRSIPLIAIQMQALRLGDQYSLVFTRVVDETPLGLVDEEEPVQEAVDRSYWEKQAGATAIGWVDGLVAQLQALDADLAPKYNKYYIGLTRRGRANNFVIFQPKKGWVWVQVRLERSEEIEVKLAEAGLGRGYDVSGKSYWLRLTRDDIEKQDPVILELFRCANEQAK